MTDKEPRFADISDTSSIEDESKRWPSNKPPGDANDVLQIIVEAARRAYANKAGGYQFDEDGILLGGMGDITSSLDDMMFDHDELLCHVGAGITHGINELVGDLDEDTAHKIRRLVQVAVGGGYLSALLDNKSASKRRGPIMSDGRSKTSAELADKIRKFSAANPNMSQTEMGRVLKVDRKTIGKYLNQ